MQHCSFSIEDLHLYGINLRKNNISRPLSNQALMVAQAVGLSIHLYSLWVIPHTGEWFLHLPAFSASRTATTIKIHYFFRKCNVFYFILCLIFLQTCYKFIQIRILQCILFFVNAAVRACENNLYRCTVRSRDFKCVTPAARRCR